jgi:hypothetical protein
VCCGVHVVLHTCALHSVQQELSAVLQKAVTDVHQMYEEAFDGYVHDATAAAAVPPAALVARHLTRQHIRQRPQSAGPQLTRQAHASSGTLDVSCGASSSALLLLTEDEQQQPQQQLQQQQRIARPHTAGARTAAAVVSTVASTAVAAAAAAATATAPMLHTEHWPEWRNGPQQARHSALITRHCEHLHRSCKQRPLSAAAAAGSVKHWTTAQQLQQQR